MDERRSGTEAAGDKSREDAAHSAINWARGTSGTRSVQAPGEAVTQNRFGLGGELPIGSVEDEARKQLHRGFRTLDALDDDARGGRPFARIKRRNSDVAEAAFHRGQELTERLGTMDEGDGAAQHHHRVEHLYPEIEVVGAKAVGGRLEMGGRHRG